MNGNKKSKMVIILLGLLGLFIILGTSYALWQITLKQQTTTL